MSGGSKPKKKDDSYFATSRRKNRRVKIIVLSIVAAVAILGVAGGIQSYLSPASNAAYGKLGSEHVHAVFMTRLNGTSFDFGQPQYQVKSSYLHVEGGNGAILHRHATGVPISEFLKSVKMDINNDNSCFITDTGTQYCNSDDRTLKYFVNGQPRSTIEDYVLADNDRILIIYGNESSAQISQINDELRQSKTQN